LNDTIQEYQDKLAKLNADKAIQEYFLSVANAFGDTLRAGEIGATLADLNSQIADAAQGSDKSLTGNSKAAIANRKALNGLVSDYQDYIQSLAASGASQSQLAAAVTQAKTDFTNQAIALGYSATEVATYAAAFDDVTVAIQNVPRNITVTANMNPAIQALNEFVAQAKTAGGAAGAGFSSSLNSSLTHFANGAVLTSQLAQYVALVTKTGSDAAREYYGNKINAIRAQLASGNYASGGKITGPGTSTSDSITINASDGEFMIRQRAVSALGEPTLNYMNKYGRIPRFANGGLIGGGSSSSGVVGFSPEDRALLRAWVERPLVAQVEYVDVARAANAGNRTITARGGN
jgi:hypothetical protein